MERIMKYTSSDLGTLYNYFLSTAFSYFNLDIRKKTLAPNYKPEDVIDLWEVYNFMFFFYSFRTHISELYTYFYKKKDSRVLSMLVLPENKRNDLRNFRHSHIHIGEDKSELIKKEEQVDEILWKTDLLIFEKVVFDYLREANETSAIKVFVGTLDVFNKRFNEMGSAFVFVSPQIFFKKRDDHL